MTRWVDQPDWTDAIAAGLIRDLSNAVYHESDMLDLWVSAGMEAGVFPNVPTARTGWNAMLRDAENAERLETLLRKAVAFRPALEPYVDPAFAQVITVHWYICTNPYKRRMFGPGSKQALIDRKALSDNLEAIVLHNYPVCSIRGKSGTGKSYSRHLIQSLAEETDIQSLPIGVDIADTFKDGLVDAKKFASWLADRLGMNPTFDVDENTHETSIADALATKFLARFADLPVRKRWIFIDGLDRPGVTDGVHVFVARLALAAARGELQGARLFITGHRGDFHTDVMNALCEEDIESIDRRHLVSFFNDIATHIGEALGDDEAGKLANQVLTRAPLTDLGQLGLAASKVAREHFGAPGP